MSFKRCFRCLSTLPMEEFYKHAQMKDGHLNKCINCTKKDVLKNKLDKIDYYKQYEKSRASIPSRVKARLEYRKTEAGKAAVRRAHRKYEDNHPERRYAQRALSNALRDGKVSKLNCFICGLEKVEGHHPDYSKPLEVVWLCTEHHKQTHAMELTSRIAA
jgi:hypothetical protein